MPKVHLKNIITSGVAEAVSNPVKQLIDLIQRQGEKHLEIQFKPT